MINEFQKFIQTHVDKFNEAFNNPYTITWTKKAEEWLGEFTSDKNKYNITIKEIEDRVFEFKYSKNEKFQLNKTADPKVFKILGTIKNAFFEFIETSPNGIIFGALDNENSRKKIYHIMCDMIVKFYPNYNYQDSLNEIQVLNNATGELINSNFAFYIIKNNNYPKEKMLKIAKKNNSKK